MSLEHNLEFRRAYRDWKIAKKGFEQDQTEFPSSRSSGLMNLGIADPDTYKAIITRRGEVHAAYFGNEEKIKSLMNETSGQYRLFGYVHYQDGTEDLSWFEYRMCLEFGEDRFIANHMVDRVTLERSGDETARVVVADDLSHTIKLPHGYPMTVRTNLMPLWEEAHLWTPFLKDKPLILTREQMTAVAKSFS